MWLSIIVTGALVGCSLSASNQTLSELQGTVQPDYHPTRTPSSTVSPPTLEGSATRTLTVIPYRLIRPSDFSLIFKLDAPVPPGEYIVTAEDTFTFESENQFKVMTYAGEIISSIDVMQINENISSPTLIVTRIHRDSNRLFIGVGSNLSTKELYVYDLDSETTWGIALECETVAGDYGYALGAEFLTFRCLDDTHTWHFINTNDPSIGFSIDVPIASGYLDSFPIWVGTEEILIKGDNGAFCLGSISDWDPGCEDLSDWVGKLSPDKKYIEIRDGLTDQLPKSIGAVSIPCLRSGQESCEPTIIDLTAYTNDQVEFTLTAGSTWIPGTTNLLFLREIDYVISSNSFDETELWLAEFPEGKLTRLDVLEGEFFLTEFIPDAQAVWLPNGKEVVLNTLSDLVVYNIETGEQRSIGNPGTVLGTITIE